MQSWKVNVQAGDGGHGATTSRLGAQGLSASLSSERNLKMEVKVQQNKKPSETSPTWQKKHQDGYGLSGETLATAGPNRPQLGHRVSIVRPETFNEPRLQHADVSELHPDFWVL